MDREELLRRYPGERERLVAAAARLVGPNEAEDVANEALLRALAAVDEFRGEAALGTWLHRIAINCAYDHLRRRNRAAEVSAELEDLPEPAGDEPDPLERRQMTQCVQAVLASLPPAQRHLLVQADVLERTAPEIARDAGITTGNAKIRLHRARRSLQAALESRCDFHHRDGGVLCCSPKAE
ncbi:MAG TPA: RNA polymerase sigma factor [Rhodocyclaceae bacterium]